MKSEAVVDKVEDRRTLEKQVKEEKKEKYEKERKQEEKEQQEKNVQQVKAVAPNATSVQEPEHVERSHAEHLVGKSGDKIEEKSIDRVAKKTHHERVANVAQEVAEASKKNGRAQIKENLKAAQNVEQSKKVLVPSKEQPENQENQKVYRPFDHVP